MGKGTKLISVSFQLIQNMVANVIRMVSRSAMMGISPSEKTSLILSISLMVRVVRVPIGVLSNWRNSRFTTFL